MSRAPRQLRRVVITGMGAVTPLGSTLKEIERSLRGSISGVRNITQFDTRGLPVHFAGEVKDFVAEDHLDAKEIRRNDRFIQMCLAASELAVADSGLDRSRFEQAGVVIGVAIGGLYSIEKTAIEIESAEVKKTEPFFIPSILTNLASGQVSIRYKSKGPNFSVASACASGSQAIGMAYREIQTGVRDVWIAGGAEAPITPLSIAGFFASRALSSANEAPVWASRPFDKERNGFVLGEGAASLILESLDSALARGARIYAEVVGYGIASDGFHVTAPEPNGEGAFQAMQEALTDAELDVKAIDYINAHATSTILGDRIEAIALERVLGDQSEKTFVSSTKSLMGHACGAAGAIETVFCLLMMEKEFLAPSFNLINPSEEFKFRAPGGLERDFQAKVVMNNSFGFGGINTSLLFKRFSI